MGRIRVRHEPASAAVVRSRLSLDLKDKGISPDSIDEVVLVASELFGNAVRHTPADPEMIEVGWHLNGNDIVVSVTDYGPGLPVPREPRLEEPHGRGLTIVEALSREWGTDVGPRPRIGYPSTPSPVEHRNVPKRVWARVPIRGV